MFSSYRRLDCYSLLQQPLPGVEVHVVRAEQSDRWSTKELRQLGEVAEQSGKALVSTDPCKPWTVLAQQKGVGTAERALGKRLIAFAWAVLPGCCFCDATLQVSWVMVFGCR